MDTNHVKAFLSICKYQSYSKAAQYMNISQSALSQQMKRLENDLGFELFHHSIKSRIQLTEQGMVFHNYSVKMMEEYNNMIQSCLSASDKIKTYRLGIDFRDLYQINQKFFDAFNQKHRNKEIKIKLENWANFISMLEENELDVVYSCDLPTALSQKYGFIEIEQSPLAIAGNPKNKIFKKETITLEDLKGQHLLLPDNNMGKRVQEINECICKDHPEIIIDGFYTDVNYIDIQNNNAVYLCENTTYLNLECRPLQSDFHLPAGFIYKKSLEKDVQEMVKIYKSLK